MKYHMLITFIVCLAISSCHDPDDYELNLRADNSDVLILVVPQDSIAADNFQVTILTAFIPIDAAENHREIVFETTAGIFLENNSNSYTVKADYPVIRGQYANKREARVTLKSSNKIEVANIRASIGGVAQRKSIRFVTAFPDRISVETSSFQLDSGFMKEITISSTISKIKGKPSSGNKIDFLVLDNANNSFPQMNFRNAMEYSDSDGKTSTIFTSGNSGYKGILKIIARVSDGTKMISDTTFVYKN